MGIIKDGKRIDEDAWRGLADEEPVPRGCPVIVSLERWRASNGDLSGHNAPLGLRMRSDQPPSLIADEVGLSVPTVRKRLRVFIDVDGEGVPTAVSGILVQTLPGGAAEGVVDWGLQKAYAWSNFPHTKGPGELTMVDAAQVAQWLEKLRQGSLTAAD